MQLRSSSGARATVQGAPVMNSPGAKQLPFDEVMRRGSPILRREGGIVYLRQGGGCAVWRHARLNLNQRGGSGASANSFRGELRGD